MIEMFSKAKVLYSDRGHSMDLNYYYYLITCMVVQYFQLSSTHAPTCVRQQINRAPPNHLIAHYPAHGKQSKVQTHIIELEFR